MVLTSTWGNVLTIYRQIVLPQLGPTLSIAVERKTVFRIALDI